MGNTASRKESPLTQVAGNNGPSEMLVKKM